MRKRLQASVRKAFERAVDLALEKRAHALLIAGDLFDNSRLTFGTERFLLEQMSRLNESGIQVYYATGNHDPGRASFRAHQIKWPPNVQLFRDISPETYPVKDRDGNVVGYVTGAGHSSPDESTNIAASFPSSKAMVDAVGSAGLCHVGLLHTWIEAARGGETHARYAPCSAADLTEKGYSYWALGHIHGRQQVLAEPQAYYPGNIQGRNPRETGEKGALLVEVDATGVLRLEFYPLAPVRWESVIVEDLSEVDSLYSLREAIMRRFSDLTSDVQSQDDLSTSVEWILRVILKGPCPIYRELLQAVNLEDLTEDLVDLTGSIHIEVKPESVSRMLNVEDYIEGPHVLSSLISMIENAEKDDDLLEMIARDYIPILAGLEPGSTCEERRRYLRNLLPGLKEDAVMRMVLETES